MQREHPSDAPIGAAREHGVVAAYSTLRFRSTAYLRALAQLDRFARAGMVTVLLEGEAGTGKTQHAAYIHRRSERADGPLLVGMLSAMDDAFAVSELFGHVAGAFTDARYARAGLFASAAAGTVFLDEIGKASRRVQQLLLHVVEYGEMKPLGSDRTVRVDPRLVVASNVPLTQLVTEGKFLPDLRARLCYFRVELPPLRERRADISILVKHFIAQHGSSHGYNTDPSVHPELLDALEGAPWPDNLRELNATIRRLLIDAQGAPVLTTDLCTGDLAHLQQRRKPRPGSLRRADVNAAIARAGDISKAARLLDVDRTTVHRILRRSPVEGS